MTSSRWRESNPLASPARNEVAVGVGNDPTITRLTAERLTKFAYPTMKKGEPIRPLLSGGGGWAHSSKPQEPLGGAHGFERTSGENSTSLLTRLVASFLNAR